MTPEELRQHRETMRQKHGTLKVRFLHSWHLSNATAVQLQAEGVSPNITSELGLDGIWTSGSEFEFSKPTAQMLIEAGICEDVAEVAARMEVKEKNSDGNLQKEVLTLLASNKRREATEALTHEALRKYRVYTTRDDEHAEMFVYHEGIYIPQARTFIKEFCRSMLGEAFTSTICNEVIAKIEADTFINSENFFKTNSINLIAVKNGILHLESGELLPFNPDIIFFQKIPVTYEKEATCPAIQQHLKDVLKSETDIPIIQEFFGYCLLKEYRIEKAFMLTGEGRNGKSKTLELLKHFIGVENCANIPLSQFERDSFAIGELFNKLANISADMDATALKNTGIFKSLTGRDLLSAQRKFLPRVTFVNYAKQIFCCNTLPISYDKTTAFWNRWVLLEFPYTFLSRKEYDALPEAEKASKKLANPDIVNQLTTPSEMSGLLNWALEGLQRLLKQGDFSYSQSTENVRNLWVRKSDSFQAFFTDCLQVKSEARIQKTLLRECYEAYCKAHKIRAMGDRHVKRVLEDVGAWDERSADILRIREWVGVGFVQPVQDVHSFLTLYEISNISIDTKQVVCLSKLDRTQQTDLTQVQEEAFQQ